MMEIVDVKNRKFIENAVFLVMLTEVFRGVNSRGVHPVIEQGK